MNTDIVRRSPVLGPLVATAAAAALVLSGCSGSSGGTTPTGSSTGAIPASSSPDATAMTTTKTSTTKTSTTKTSTTKTSTTVGSTASSPTASSLDRFVLRAGDLPSGFTAHAGDKDTTGGGGDSAAIAKCSGTEDTSKDEIATHNSKDYSTEQFDISSSVSLVKSQHDVDADVAQLKSPKLAGCLVKVLRKELPSSLPTGSKVGAAKATVTPGHAGGPRNLAGLADVAFTVTVNGTTTSLYMSTAFVSGPKLEAEIDFQGVAAPVPTALRNELIAAVARRVAQK